MPIDPTLLTKAAKVYEAAESVEGGKPKEVYESHKQCTPGEFGMNKEGGSFARFVKKTAEDTTERALRDKLKAYNSAPAHNRSWSEDLDQHGHIIPPGMVERSPVAEERYLQVTDKMFGDRADQNRNRAMLPFAGQLAGKVLGGDIGASIGNVAGTGMSMYAGQQHDEEDADAMSNARRVENMRTLGQWRNVNPVAKRPFELAPPAQAPQLPIGQPRPPVKMPPRGAGPRPAPKPAPTVPGMNKASGNFAGRRSPLAMGAAAGTQAAQPQAQPSIFSSLFKPKPATPPAGVPQPGAAAPKPAPAPAPAPAQGIFNKMSAGNEGWKGFDYSKVGPGGLIGSRTLPKTDATAKNWQGTQGTPRKPGSATAPADQKNPPMKPVPQPMMKKISAFVFGQLMARNTGK